MSPPLRRHERFTIDVADRSWTLDLASQDRFDAPRALSVMITVFGAALALVTGQLVRRRERRIAAELEAAQEVRRQSEMRSLLLEETKHRLKNAIARSAPSRGSRRGRRPRHRSSSGR